MFLYRENKIVIFDAIIPENFHPRLTIYGVIIIVSIVIVPIIGSRKEFVTPISIPHFAMIDANPHLKDDTLNPTFSEAELLYPSALAGLKTVRNFAIYDITYQN